MSSPPRAASIEVRVNGQPIQLDRGATVTDVLQQLNIPPEASAVELNLEIVPREKYGIQSLEADDQLEIVSLAGGG